MTRCSSRILGIVTLTFVLTLGSVIQAQDASDAQTKIKKLNQITGTEAFRTALKGLLKDEKDSKVLVAEAVKMAKDKPENLTYNSSYLLGLAARNQKDYPAARALLKLSCVKAIDLLSVNKAFDSYQNLVDVLMLEKKYDEAADEIQQFLKQKLSEKSEEFAQMEILIQERLIQALAAKGKIDEALKKATELVDRFNGYPRFLRLKADVLREGEKYDEAETAYQQALSTLIKNKADADDEESSEKKDEIRLTRYLLSGIYVDMNKVEKAADQLKILLKETPDNPTFNNDLGYIWADHNLNLDESEKLVRKAIEEQTKINKKRAENGLEPLDGAAYLDSLGWVLFKKKKFPEAKKELLEAVKTPEGQHVEILDHLADVHMILGEKADAIKVWEQALKVESETKRDKKRKVEIEQKLKKAKEAKEEKK
ncbi:tetratricopeptide repeat protein [Telmatocola sphagniphila]|uniref:Tetratricopeptide repeat protein n=1 Tax=Telmatocola sphagniphila TaxID=1123043 RepID=A0A8E6EY49_9BACT|nr:tetratricopeptide repeat protein [Telmatocola sphagniphila]QVL32006.1 tetratricopeptide repeat protein [Telmatocola sphagniphila]